MAYPRWSCLIHLLVAIAMILGLCPLGLGAPGSRAEPAPPPRWERIRIVGPTVPPPTLPASTIPTPTLPAISTVMPTPDITPEPAGSGPVRLSAIGAPHSASLLDVSASPH